MKIKLSEEVRIDLDKLIESRLLVQANSGGGKSWAIRRIIEQAFGHVQIIVIDPEGEFGNMRKEFDFVYAGKDGDAPAEPRSATLLARRLLELKASAVIDLYELPPKDRKHFVRLFCESLVNAPKELWHDVLVIIDEAHVFAPEKDESEALGAVIDLASRGRKRGYCAVLATQRPAKLAKDAAAECNNKLIGRASLDIDRKRAAEELGLTSKESVLSLRDLAPGEFYVFGPAISREVIRVDIGDVKVRPPKRGVAKQSVAAPSATVKKMLAKLADLPAEAQKEAQTVHELQKKVSELYTQLKAANRGAVLPPNPEADKKIQQKWYDLGYEAAKHNEREFKKFKEKIYRALLKTHGNFESALKQLGMEIKELEPNPTDDMKAIPFVAPPTVSPAYTVNTDTRRRIVDEVGEVTPKQWDALESRTMGAGERQVLIAIAQHPDGMTREHITVQTGYKRSTRDAYIQRLAAKGYISLGNDGVHVTQLGIDALGDDYEPLPTGPELVDYHLRKLPEGEAKILKFLLEDVNTEDGASYRDSITNATGFKRSTRDAYIQRLAARGLVTTKGGLVAVSKHLL